MNFIDFLCKYPTFISTSRQTNELIYQNFKCIVQVPHLHENAAKTGMWSKKFLTNSVIEKKVYTTFYYDKADKITEIKNILILNSNLEIFLFRFNLFHDINIFLAEPTIVAAEHGYDIFTRNGFLHIRLRILNTEEFINRTYLTTFKYLFDANLYKPKD